MKKVVRCFEKLDKDYIAVVTGVKKELIDQLFTVGDVFKISTILYKIKHKTENEFLCECLHFASDNSWLKLNNQK